MIRTAFQNIIQPANLDSKSRQLTNVTPDTRSFHSFLDEASGQRVRERDKPVTIPEDNGFDNKTSLLSILNELIGPNRAASVNEEQLFASIIFERIEASKGEPVAREYQALLEEKMGENRLENGYIYVETAARDALAEMERNGNLTLEEAETIHAQAFQAAQLDNNTSALFDSFGTTMSTAPAATATEKVLAKLLQFDDGIVDSGKMSLSYQQAQYVGKQGMRIETSNTDPEIGLTGTPVEELTGLRWNPVSTDVETLAVVLPMQMQGVGNVYVTNGSNQIIEEGFHSGEDKGRLVYRFNQRGEQYPDPSILNVQMENGDIYKFQIPSPAELTTDVIPFLV